MKSDRKIFIAFILNLFFSIFEFFGGIVTGSISIASDSLHDFGDAITIGTSYFLEKKSKRKPDKKYTYGYLGFSVLGGAITNLVLLLGSILIIYKAVQRLINPITVNYDGVITFAIVGILVNLLAGFFTRDKETINQKAVNLHMLEDALGWFTVLIGGITAIIFNLQYIDAILSIILSLFIVINALKGLKEIIDVYTLKTPKNVEVDKLTSELNEIEEISEIHHLHVWSIDGNNNYATLHVVSDSELNLVKGRVKEIFYINHIKHVTVEIEKTEELCEEKQCKIREKKHCCHHHHGHYH